MKRVLALILAQMMLLTACSGQTSNPTSKGTTLVGESANPNNGNMEDWKNRSKVSTEKPVTKNFLSVLNKFSWKTAAELFSTGEENLCYSPLSLYYALAMVTAGAKGDTEQQLLELLGTDQTTLADQCNNLYWNLYQTGENSALLMANSLWLAKEVQGNPVTYQQDFVDNAVQQFYADLFTVDFSSPNTGKDIAQWIEKKTNGLLSYRPQDSDSRMMAIINTIYFKDQWSDQFNQRNTAPDTFHADNGDVTCDFMRRRTEGVVIQGRNYTQASLSLRNNGSVTFYLPNEDATVQEVIQGLAAGEIGEMNYASIKWYVPKFTFDSQLYLMEALKTLGVEDAFNNRADFSGIADAESYISDIIQGTHVGMDENGVEAAAYTVLGMIGSAAPPAEQIEMNLNRPFLFTITSQEGAVLFMGVCGNPTA
jgi:serpin B